MEYIFKKFNVSALIFLFAFIYISIYINISSVLSTNGEGKKKIGGRAIAALKPKHIRFTEDASTQTEKISNKDAIPKETEAEKFLLYRIYIVLQHIMKMIYRYPEFMLFSKRGDYQSFKEESQLVLYLNINPNLKKTVEQMLSEDVTRPLKHLLFDQVKIKNVNGVNVVKFNADTVLYQRKLLDCIELLRSGALNNKSADEMQVYITKLIDAFKKRKLSRKFGRIVVKINTNELPKTTDELSVDTVN